MASFSSFCCFILLCVSLAFAFPSQCVTLLNILTAPALGRIQFLGKQLKAKFNWTQFFTPLCGPLGSVLPSLSQIKEAGTTFPELGGLLLVFNGAQIQSQRVKWGQYVDWVHCFITYPAQPNVIPLSLESLVATFAEFTYTVVPQHVFPEPLWMMKFMDN